MEAETRDADYWKNKGNSLYKSGSYEAAIAAYSEAIGLNSETASLYTNRAAASLMLLQYKEALRDCDAAIQLDSTNSKAYFRKATALKGLGSLNAAIEALTEGLQHDPKSQTALKDKETLEQAVIKIAELRRLVDAKQCRGALSQVERLQAAIGPSFRDVSILRARCLMGLSRLEEAYNITNTMMKTAAHGDVELLHLRAQVFYAMGDLDNAFKHLQQAARSDPDNTDVRAFYRRVRDVLEMKKVGDDLFRNGDNEDAIVSWTQAIGLCGTDNPIFLSKLYLNRATALTKLKKYDKGIDDCTLAIRHNAGYVKAYLRRAECYMALGGEEKIPLAINDYEKLLELETDDSNLDSVKQKIKKAKVALKRSKRKDLYTILGVSQGASEAEIRTAYKKSALRCHPDKQVGKSEEEKKAAEATFKAVNEAYEVLSDPAKKERYDQGVEVEELDDPHSETRRGGGQFRGGIDPAMFFHHFMQGQRGGF